MTRSGEFDQPARGEPGTRDRILEIYGAFVRDAGGWIAVAALVELLSAFDIAAPSARAALTRMKRRGEIVSVTRDEQRGYTLSAPTDEWISDGTPRILVRESTEGLDITGHWTLASFSVPEHERNVRYLIRTRLAALGFGSLAGGLMIAPSAIRGEAMQALRRSSLDGYVVLWDSVHAGFGGIDEVIANAWDLPAIRSAYRTYLATATRLERRPPPVNDRDAFTRFLTNLNAWRELPFLDPGLPSAALPSNWPGPAARARFVQLSSSLRPSAQRHFDQVTQPCAT